MNKMSKFDKLVFIDLDGVLANFEAKVRQVTGSIAPLGSVQWQIDADIASTQPGFYRIMPPMPGARMAIAELSQVYEVHINVINLSSRH